MMTSPIYLDHHSTTPCDERVLSEMLPYFTQYYSNISQVAKEAVEKARIQVARLIHAQPEEIVFTSGATEANNLGLMGFVKANAHKGKHIVSAKTEHRSVLDTLSELTHLGFEVTFVSVDKKGRVDPLELKSCLRTDTILVSLMMANNEIGTILPISEFAHEISAQGVCFHSDAVQALPYVDINFETSGVQLLTLSGHKINGPKGVGALVVKNKKPRLKLSPQSFGGGQEKGLRSGTLNIPAIVGFGKACEIVQAEKKQNGSDVEKLRDHLQRALMAEVRGLYINGDQQNRLPNNLNFCVEGLGGISLISKFKEIQVSSGSACNASSPLPSHVLSAIGVSEYEALSAVRVGLGKMNTIEQIDVCAQEMIRVIGSMQGVYK